MSAAESYQEVYSILPPEQFVICPLAALRRETIWSGRSILTEGDEIMIVHESKALAVVEPRQNIVARLYGSRKIIDTAAQTITAHANYPVGAIVNARYKATAEALFKHLQINCSVCPYSKRCSYQGKLAEDARQLNSESF